MLALEESVSSPKSHSSAASMAFCFTFLFNRLLVLCSSTNVPKSLFISSFLGSANTAAFKISLLSGSSSQLIDFEIAQHYHYNLLKKRSQDFPNTIFDGLVASFTGRNEKLVKHYSTCLHATLVRISAKFHAKL